MKRVVATFVLAVVIGLVIATLAIGVQAAAIIGIAYLIGVKLTLAQALGISLALSLVASFVRSRHA